MILGIIPARGGSTGVHKKNLAHCAGYPLIWWTLEAARHSTHMDAVVVSTEDEEIADYVRWYAGEHSHFKLEVWDRDPDLALNTSTTLAVLQEVAENYEDGDDAVTHGLTRNDTIVVLQPTSPFRMLGIIDRAIAKFLKLDVDTLATCKRSYEYEFGTKDNIPRAIMDGFLYDDGNVYVHKVSSILDGNWIGPKKYGWELPSQYNHEIDTRAELWMAEGLLLNWSRERDRI